jgi:hypothetical protein
MTPLVQTDLSRETGNCLEASMASVLDLPLAEMPKFEHDGDHDPTYWDKWEPWLRERNLALHWFRVTDGGWVPPGYALLNSLIAEGLRHATVVLDGKVIWNPWPGSTPETNVGEWKEFGLFQVLDPSKPIGKPAAA